MFDESDSDAAISWAAGRDDNHEHVVVVLMCF